MTAGMSAAIGTSIDPLRLVTEYGSRWYEPPQRFGPDGWTMRRLDRRTSIIVTVADWNDVEWVHASIAHVDRMPDYPDLVRLHRAVWGSAGFAYQVFAAADEHVNIHKHALHLWGRLDGSNVLPDFGAFGTI
jgi:hypothetical protein